MSNTSTSPTVRINKYLADQKIASRREADTMIKKGQVFVNGQPATVGQTVSASDIVTVAGQAQQKSYFAYYKGRGVITHSPQANEIDIATKIKTDFSLTDVSPIGRLDKDSEGLILLSNDGRITGPLLSPDQNIEKEYEVTLDKPINHWFLKHMNAGVMIEGYRTKPTVTTIHPKNNTRCTIVLTEGKKHQIRRMCAALGYQVQSLKRVRIMHIHLGKLKPNQYRKLTQGEKQTLLRKLHIAPANPNAASNSRNAK